MAPGLPLTAALERYAALRAALDKPAFLKALPGPAVLIRLDERGGDDEPAPWAFHGAGLPFPVDVPSSDDDVFLSTEQTPSDQTLELPLDVGDRDVGPRAGAVEGMATGKRAGKSKRSRAQEAGPLDRTTTGPMFSLSIPAARGRATVHVVPHGTQAVIGRDRACDVVVAERSISKRHARLLLEATHAARARAGARARGAKKALVKVVDLGSHNGVAINGRRLKMGGQDVISSGDVLDLGDVSLLLLDAGEFFDGLPRLTDG